MKSPSKEILRALLEKAPDQPAWRCVWGSGQNQLIYPHVCHTVIVTVKYLATSLSAMKNDSCECCMSPKTIISTLNIVYFCCLDRKCSWSYSIGLHLPCPPPPGEHCHMIRNGVGSSAYARKQEMKSLEKMLFLHLQKCQVKANSLKLLALSLALSFDLWATPDPMGDGGHVSCFSFRKTPH